MLSPYLTMRISQFGAYVTVEVTIIPEQYGAHLPGIDLILVSVV